MKIVIATGIFPPEAGGPATYAEQLGRRFTDMGHHVTVVTYASEAPGGTFPFTLCWVRRGNPVMHRLRFFVTLFSVSRGADIIYALDWFAAGVPVLVVSRLLGIRYIVRVGGDYFWEQKYLPSGEPPMTLRAFYESGTYARRYAGTMSDSLIRAVFAGARAVVFNSMTQRDLYVRFLGVPESRTRVIENPLPRVFVEDLHRERPTREFVFWGRFIVMKNLSNLLRAFAKAQLPDGFTLTLIGDGPERGVLDAQVVELSLTGKVAFEKGRPLHDVLLRVKDARAFVLPSWTDISPNQVAEAIAIGLPVILTKENFLPAAIDALAQRHIDPSSVDDIASAFREFAQDALPETAGVQPDMSAFPDWETVADAFLALSDKMDA